MNIETKTFQIELVNASKSSLRETIRAACLHEQGSEELKVAGDGISGVLHRTAVEVYTQALSIAKEKGVDAPVGAVIKVLFCEALHDAEESIREESSAFKHMKKLPRAWTNAKSQLCIYLEYDKIDWANQSTVSSIQKWNKEHKTGLENQAARQFIKDTGGKPELASDNKKPAGTTADQPVVTKPAIDTDGLSADVLAMLTEIAAICHDVDPLKAVKMLKGVKGQLSGVAKSALKRMAS